MADGVLGGCFCVTSLRAKYIAIIIAVPKRNATVYKEHLKHFFFQYQYYVKNKFINWQLSEILYTVLYVVRTGQLSLVRTLNKNRLYC